VQSAKDKLKILERKIKMEKSNAFEAWDSTDFVLFR
jgi:hypothetical protein